VTSAPSRRTGAGAASGPVTEDAPSTRNRILDAALDLFIEHGYDGTSLREVAGALGVTKAAIYYYFASKDDILMALHMRLHEFGRDALDELARQPVTLSLWAELLDHLTDQMLAQRRIFLMHERNQAAIEKIHGREHDMEHDDLQSRLREVLSDARRPLRDRVRMACSFGAVFATLFMVGDSFEAVPNDELGQLLGEMVHDMLRT
jgi:AcrR family transcriptional regulator